MKREWTDLTPPPLLFRMLKPHVCKHGGYWWMVYPNRTIYGHKGEGAPGFYNHTKFDPYSVIRLLIAAGKLIGYRDGE